MFIAGINLLSPGDICMMAHFHCFVTISFQKKEEEKKRETTTGSAFIETANSQQMFTTFSINNEFKLLQIMTPFLKTSRVIQ